MTTIAAESQQLATTDFVVLYEIWLGDIAPALTGDDRYFRFTAMTNGLGQPVIFGGKTFTTYPIEAEGFGLNAQGSPPRPKLRAANLGGALSAVFMAYQDMLLAKVTRIKTFSRFLDAVNFIDGNPDADPNQHFPLETYFIERRSEENTVFIECELRWSFDLQSIQLPGRPIVQNLCPSQYKSAECSWVPVPGRYYDAADQVTDAEGDICSQKLTGCRLRFGAKSVLPFGGFPAAGLVRQ